MTAEPLDCRKILGDTAGIISSCTAYEALKAMREKAERGGYDNLLVDDRSFIRASMAELEMLANSSTNPASPEPSSTTPQAG